MLTSRKLTGNPETVSKYHTKEENYYFSQAEGVESVLGDSSGQGHVLIHGGLAPIIGFTAGQRINEEQLTNLLAGKDSTGNKVTREHKVIGIDLTFSAPKSVSVAALLTHRDPRIVAAHDKAVLETMGEIESECAGTQPRAGEHEKTRNMAYVTVRDGFNRDHDPHLHTHVVVANMTRYGDKVLALDGREIMAKDFNKMWGGMYRAKLAASLKELGYAVTYTKKGEFRLDAVSLDVERVFSGRRAEITAQKERGVRDMEAWRSTRKAKDPEIAKKDVVASWKQRLAQFAEKTPEENRREAVAERKRWFEEAKWSVEARQELAGERGTSEIGRWQVAARRATQTSACVKEQAVITEYLTEMGRTETWNGVTYMEAQQAFQAQVRAGHILATDDGFYTTWEMARADRECVLQRGAPVELTLAPAETRRELVRYSRAEDDAGRKTLSERQADVAVGILSASQGTVVVQGDAGSGKTTMLKGVNMVALHAGWEVVGVAIQGVAARKLEEESGIKSTTMAAYLTQERAMSGRGGLTRVVSPGRRLVVFDEASMLDSRGLARLQRVAAQHGDKVVLVGDRNQIQSVGAGKPFERLVEAAEASRRLLSLQENYRQRDPALRKAVDMARQGYMRESLDWLEEKGHVSEIQDAVLRRTMIAKLYKEGTLIMTGTQESAEDLNKRIRGSLAVKGKLESKTTREYEVSWEDADGISHKAFREIAVGERIRFLKNEYRHYDLRNGECGVVMKAGEKDLAVRLEDGREIKLELSRYNAIDYGYAVTTYKGQGQTFDRVLVEADTELPYLQDQRNSYVQITRARDEIHIFTDDRETLREVAGVLSVKRDTLKLPGGVEEARRMEARLGELARDETLAKGLTASSVGRHAAKSLERAAVADTGVGPVRIDIKTLLEAADGVEMFENVLLEHGRVIEERLNARIDIDSDRKRRLAAFFSRSEAALLLSLADESSDMKIAGAEVALGSRSKEDVCEGFSKVDIRSLEYCAQLAAEALESPGHERAMERGYFGEMGPDR